MANGIVEEASIQGIADAIRVKNEKTNKYKPADMSQAIKDIALGVDTSDATAGSYNVSKNKTAYAKGEKITGTVEDTVPEYPTTKPTETVYSENLVRLDLSDLQNEIVFTYRPSESLKGAGKDGIILRPDIPLKQPNASIKGLENLNESNIKSGVNIAGITGTYETNLTELEDITYDILGAYQTLTTNEVTDLIMNNYTFDNEYMINNLSNNSIYGIIEYESTKFGRELPYDEPNYNKIKLCVTINNYRFEFIPPYVPTDKNYYIYSVSIYNLINPDDYYFNGSDETITSYHQSGNIDVVRLACNNRTQIKEIKCIDMYNNRTLTHDELFRVIDILIRTKMIEFIKKNEIN